MRSGETPVHIPNTMVKTCTAESTALETVWEVRWLPDQISSIISVITYLDNFTLIKIIKETYVDLIVTDIRFYRMNRNIDSIIQTNSSNKGSEKSDLSSNLFNKFLRTRKTSVTLYRRTAKTVYRSSK